MERGSPPVTKSQEILRGIAHIITYEIENISIGYIAIEYQLSILALFIVLAGYPCSFY